MKVNFLRSGAVAAALLGMIAPQAFAQQGYNPYAQTGYGQPAYQNTQSYQPGQPIGRYAMNGANLPAPAEQVQQPRPNAQAQGPAYNPTPQQQAPQQQAAQYHAPAYQPVAPAAHPAPAVASYAAPGADCGCNQPTAAPAQSWEGYMPAASAPASGGCATGSCGTGGGYYTGAGAGCYEAPGYGGNALAGCYNDGPQRQWFLGMYGLYMGRDNPGKATSAFLVEDTTGLPPSYYPNPSRDLFLITSQAEVDFQGGAEIRFGSTLGHANCTGQQPFAWEVGYWALAEDTNFAEITDNFGGTSRLYGMINYAGLEYDRDGVGGGSYAYRPLNDYYDFQAPVDTANTNDLRVLAVRVTQSFSAQNLELNFWRFGNSQSANALLGGGLAALGRGGYGAGGYGAGGYGCDSSGYNSCNSGSCGTGGCSPCGGCGTCGPQRRFLINGLAGVRYFTTDETFRNATFFTSGIGGDSTVYDGSMPTEGAFADQTVFHDVEVDNKLLGFQLGSSMNYIASNKWSLFADTNLGIYGNQIDSYQRIFSPGGGTIRFVDSTGDAAVRSSKTDVAFIGEARLGAAYQINPCWRLTAAYRAMAVSGVALAVEQVSTPINEAEFGHIDSNDSLIIHGLQAGVECKF